MVRISHVLFALALLCTVALSRLYAQTCEEGCYNYQFWKIGNTNTECLKYPSAGAGELKGCALDYISWLKGEVVPADTMYPMSADKPPDVKCILAGGEPELLGGEEEPIEGNIYYGYCDSECTGVKTLPQKGDAATWESFDEWDSNVEIPQCAKQPDN